MVAPEFTENEYVDPALCFVTVATFPDVPTTLIVPPEFTVTDDPVPNFREAFAFTFNVPEILIASLPVLSPALNVKPFRFNSPPLIVVDPAVDKLFVVNVYTVEAPPAIVKLLNEDVPGFNVTEPAVLEFNVTVAVEVVRATNVPLLIQFPFTVNE